MNVAKAKKFSEEKVKKTVSVASTQFPLCKLQIGYFYYLFLLLLQLPFSVRQSRKVDD